MLCSNYSVPVPIYALSLHDALPILPARALCVVGEAGAHARPGVGRRLRQRPGLGPPLRALRAGGRDRRSEEHTSELQSRRDLVCSLLLEKKNSIRTQEAYVGVDSLR